MQLTSNYQLKKPEGTDVVNIDDFNTDADIIDNALKVHDTQLSELTQDRIYYCGTTSGTNTYTATNSKITTYKDGLTVRVKIGTASTGASTLNINGLGAKTILDSLGNSITSGGLKVGLPYQLCYNGTNFIVLGKGGGGNATKDQVLNGIKVTVDSGQIVGEMPNNGALNYTMPINGSYTIPLGYTSGGTINQNIQTKATATITPSTVNQTISAGQYLNGDQTILGDSDLTENNIISTANIFGIQGKATIASLGGYRMISGTAITPYGTSITVNAGFVPVLIYATYHEYHWFYFPSYTINAQGRDSGSFNVRGGYFTISGTTFTISLAGTTNGSSINWYAIG